MTPRWEEFFEVFHVSSLSSNHDLKKYDAVLMDLSLAENRRGEQIYEETVKARFQGPTFVLSNDEKIGTKLRLLRMGITDYLWKSMPEEEVLLRILNGIQRTTGPASRAAPESSTKIGTPSSLIQVEELTLDPAAMKIYLNGNSIDLSKIEYRLLHVLLTRQPTSTDVTTLCSEVWSLPRVEDGTINTFIWKLNKKTEGWSYRIRRKGHELLIVRKSS